MKQVLITDAVSITNQRVKSFEGTKEYLATGGLMNGNIKTKKVTFESKPSRADLTIRTNQLIVARMKDTDKVLLIKKEFNELVVSTGFLVLEVEKNWHPQFLFHYFHSYGFHKQKNKLSTGATQKAINNSNFNKVTVPCFSYEIQKRIVKILDQADSLRQKRKQAIQLIDEYLKAVFLEMFGDPARNKQKLKIGTIAELVSEVKYGTSSASNPKGQYPYLRMNNITYSGELSIADLKYVDVADKDKEKYLARKGDLLFNRTNSKELVGKTTIYNLDDKMAIAGYLIRVRTNKKALPEYISGYLNSNHGKKTLQHMCKNIVGMANINAKELQKIKILIPPIEQQKKYKIILKQIKATKNKMLLQADELETQFQALSQRAFKGEL